jgi:hypothetical protein
MTRKKTLVMSLLVMALPFALAGMTFAGGEHCNHGKETAAVTDKGEGCPIAKGVKSVARMTDDGAIVTLSGKNEMAIQHIQAHLKAHQAGESCPDCPLSKTGITTQVDITKDGGVFTVHGNSAETIKAIQEWASKPMGACCAHGHEGDKA